MGSLDGILGTQRPVQVVGFDVHTHLDWDFGHAGTADTFETGTRATALGGTNCLADLL